MTTQRTGLLDRLIGGCLTLLVAAVAVYVAVRLIEAVWTALMVIGLVVLGGWTAFVVYRQRTGGW